jgi:hypothetical protein
VLGGELERNPGIEAVPWGARQVALLDPFGNTLRFNEYEQERRKLSHCLSVRSPRPATLAKEASCYSNLVATQQIQ